MSTPVIQVERFSYAPDCTLSVISVKGTQFECYGIELPWLENRRGKSCIPVGEYSAKVGLHYGTATSPSIELESVPGRSDIEIHAANKPSQLLGCIAPGRRLGALRKERAVLESRAALGRLLTALVTAGAPKGGFGEPEFGAPVRVHVTDNLLRFRHFPHLAKLDT